jgi:hypothetical protein
MFYVFGAEVSCKNGLDIYFMKQVGLVWPDNEADVCIFVKK